MAKLPIKSNEPKGASIWERAKARFREEKEERRVSAIPPRYTYHRCAVTGRRWVNEWKVLPGCDLFQRVRTIDLREEGQAPKGFTPPSRESAARLADHDLSEFAWFEEACRGCGHDEVTVHCNCGEVVCGGRSIIKKNGSTFFICDEKCGKRSGCRSGVTKVGAGEGQPEGRKANRSDVKALPKPSLRLPKPGKK